MPDVNDVRSLAAAFRVQAERLVRRGDGPPPDDLPVSVMCYHDMSTKPPTAWQRTRSGMVKTPHGATE